MGNPSSDELPVVRKVVSQRTTIRLNLLTNFHWVYFSGDYFSRRGTSFLQRIPPMRHLQLFSQPISRNRLQPLHSMFDILCAFSGPHRMLFGNLDLHTGSRRPL